MCEYSTCINTSVQILRVKAVDVGKSRHERYVLAAKLIARRTK